MQIRPSGAESELIIQFKDKSDRTVEISCNRQGEFAVGNEIDVFYLATDPLDAIVQDGSAFSGKSLIGMVASFIVGISLLLYGIQRALMIW